MPWKSLAVNEKIPVLKYRSSWVGSNRQSDTGTKNQESEHESCTNLFSWYQTCNTSLRNYRFHHNNRVFGPSSSNTARNRCQGHVTSTSKRGCHVMRYFVSTEWPVCFVLLWSISEHTCYRWIQFNDWLEILDQSRSRGYQSPLWESHGLFVSHVVIPTNDSWLGNTSV